MGPSQVLWLFASFSGRVSRQAYALAGLLLYLARMLPVYKISIATSEQDATYWSGVLIIVGAVSLAAHVPLAAKRFQDFAKPGWFGLFSIVADFFMFVVLCFIPGDRGPNRYGVQTNAPR